MIDLRKLVNERMDRAGYAADNPIILRQALSCPM